MRNFWNWFLAHGDKLLTTLATLALSPAIAPILPHWAPAVLASLGLLHTVALPEPPATPK